MSSGAKADSLLGATAAQPLGWRVANALAIAAPYLLAAALFIVLYLPAGAPPAQADLGAASEPATPAETAADIPAPVPSTAVPSAAAARPEASAKNAASPHAPTPATPVAATSAQEPPVPAGPVPVDPVYASTMRLPGDSLDAVIAAVRATHIQGTVVLAATIGANGAVQSVEPVSGPALLEAATLNAVRGWRYRPWLVQGHPVPFTTQIILDFRLNQGPQ